VLQPLEGLQEPKTRQVSYSFYHSKKENQQTYSNDNDGDGLNNNSNQLTKQFAR
jgi:hypothetical protein